MADTTILLYGRTNAGKTAQVGELAEYVKSKTGLDTRLYTADKGGVDTIKPYVNLGIVDVVSIGESDPWIFLNAAVRGKVRQGQKWVLDPAANKKVGLYAFESMRSIAEALMTSMAQMAGRGTNIGGGSNISFQVASEGETLKISGSNMAHFGVAQARMTEEIWESQKLAAPYVLWTSSVSKDDDLNAAGKVLGPDVIGKALTTEVPRWFNLTFRIDVIPAQQGKPERHILYLGNHVDVGAGNASGLGNVRLPLDSPKLDVNVIEPASISKALDLLTRSTTSAEDAIRKRLAGKL